MGTIEIRWLSDGTGCDAIPEYPDAVSSSPFSNNEMDLRTMCRRAFEIGARVDSGANPTVTTGQRVACPPELYKVTGLRLLSDDTFTDNEAFTNGGVTRWSMDANRVLGGLIMLSMLIQLSRYDWLWT